MRNLTLYSCLFLFALPVVAAPGVDALSNKDMVGGLKEALIKSAEITVKKLGATDGYLGNPQIKIPLPESLQKVEGMMKKFGMGKQAEELVVSMNRAAEAAAPEAKAMLIDAAKKMSVQDAKGILTGGDNAATQYFRGATQVQLTQKFLPIVKKATQKVRLAAKYNDFAGKGAKFGLVDAKDANLENYVTQKALDGLYLMMAQEERAIRQDPVGQASKLLQKVFGAL